MKDQIITYSVSLDLGRMIEYLVYKRFKIETTARKTAESVFNVVVDNNIPLEKYNTISVYVQGIVDCYCR